MPVFGRDDLTPVFAEMLPRRDENRHPGDVNNDADNTENGIYRGEVDEAEYRQIRQHERGDDGKQQAKVLPQMRFRVLFSADPGDAQIHNEHEPQSIDEPDKD